MERELGSFRDPSGYIYFREGRVFRSVMACAEEDFAFVRRSGLFDELVAREKLVGYREIDDEGVLADCAAFHHGTSPKIVLEHPHLPFISYPYEWCCHALRDAALLQLDIYLTALKRDVMLSDATAYNIQFQGTSPIFIDHLSFRPYRVNEKGEGEAWVAHQQFCDEFLNPILLRFLGGISYNAWYRGSIGGITTIDLNKLIPPLKKFSYGAFVHLVLPAILLRNSLKRSEKYDQKAKKVSFSKEKLLYILKEMKSYVEKFNDPPPLDGCVWNDYADNNSYLSDEQKVKQAFISEFAQKARPKLLCDLGCNTGHYSEIALNNGAEAAVGLDFDVMAIEKAYINAKRKKLNFLPLCVDMTNPSPSQGWGNAERKNLTQRIKADAVIALALVHHLAIAKNVPLGWVISEIMAFAKTGVIEFVPKSDPMVQKLLLLRDDIFADYTQENFEALLSKKAKLVKTATTNQFGRRLYWYAEH